MRSRPIPLLLVGALPPAPLMLLVWMERWMPGAAWALSAAIALTLACGVLAVLARPKRHWAVAIALLSYAALAIGVDVVGCLLAELGGEPCLP